MKKLNTITNKQRLASIFAITVLCSAIIANIFSYSRTSAQTDTFNSSGTWQAPAGVFSVTVDAWGGGGAGGGAQGNPSTGGGGAGGSFARKVISVTPSNNYTVTVGTGGTGGTGNGTGGGNSWFDSNTAILATGGAGGQTDGNVNSTNGNPGLGSCASCIGDTVFAGGNGSQGDFTSGSGYSGAGGGGAGNTGVGGNASLGTGGTGVSGGGNGANGVGNNSNGVVGAVAGGGGSGGMANNNPDRSGGNGANGLVEVTYVLNAAPSAPTLSTPSDLATGVSTEPTFELRSSDAENDYLRYRIDLCSNNDCTAVVRTIDQTISQTGWSNQDAETGSAYVGNSNISLSTLASHTYQAPALSNSTEYWWRAYAIDPGGSNSWGSVSAINSFTTEAPANQAPSSPTLLAPVDEATSVNVAPVFELRSSDADNDYLRYRIDVCSNSDCSTVLRTINQMASQTGWTGQDTQGNTAYVGSSVLSSSTIASHEYQAPALSYSTQYWWRAYAIDPGGTNTWSSPSSIYSFTTDVEPGPPGSNTHIRGGSQIRGGTRIGN